MYAGDCGRAAGRGPGTWPCSRFRRGAAHDGHDPAAAYLVGPEGGGGRAPKIALDAIDGHVDGDHHQRLVEVSRLVLQAALQVASAAVAAEQVQHDSHRAPQGFGHLARRRAGEGGLHTAPGG